MNLTRVALHNYRAFPTAVLQLPPAGVVLVAGANNSGKSALLSAFDAVVRGTTYANMGYAGAGDANLVFRFSLGGEERETMVELIHNRELNVDQQDIFDWVELTFETSQAGGVVLTEIAVRWTDDAVLPIARNNISANELQVAPLFNPPMEGDPLALRLLGVGARIEGTFGGGQPIYSLMQGLRDLRAGYYHFEPLRPGASPSGSFDSRELLSPTGQDLPAVVRYFADNDPVVYRKIAATLAELVPELGTMSFRSIGSTQELVFDDPSNPAFRQNLQDLGTGVEQLLMAVVVGVAQPQARTVLIEEPETALEPGAQRALVSLLNRWSEDRLFIVSTHSTSMIDWSSPSLGRLYHVRRVGGRSSLTRIRDGLRRLLDGLGVRLSDVMSAETIILVEGRSDREVLGEFFPSLMEDPRIAVIPGGGGDHAHLAPILQNWLGQADRLGHRRVVFVRDRGELSPELLAELEEKRLVLVLPRREIENYLLDADAISSVLSSIRGEAVESREVERALRDAANELREQTILGRVWWRLPPIRLVDRDLKRAISGHTDKLEGLLRALHERLPNKDDLEAEVRRLWDNAAKDVDARWESDWRSLAPGKDVLNSVFERFAGRGYRETADGVAIARAIGGAPQELATLLPVNRQE